MKTFLHYVAKDILEKYGSNLSRIAVVFPNKRASLFMNEELARLTDQPLWSPAYITISDLFRTHSSLQVGDPIKLICKLYEVYCKIVNTSETLDKFYGWGQLMIADFDDLDKNMADADKVFANLKDIHEFDDISYLSDDQKEMLKKFFSNFSEEHNSELKKRFLDLWSHFGDIYHQFNAALAEEKLAYEGALYRNVVESEDINYEYDTYLFVGFNMMQVVEQKLCSNLQKEGKARFYWDFDKYFMQQPTANGLRKAPNEAGHYIRQYLAKYPNELDNLDDEIYNNLNKEKDITYISAPTENIQARYISKWLLENERYKAGRRTAIVLSDESLLQTVIHCIPEEVEKVNITLGYPLQQSPFYSLVTLLIQMQTIGHKTGTDRYRLHYVNLVLHHPYSQYISPKIGELIENLKQQKRFYPSRESMVLDNDEGLMLLFRDCESGEGNQNALLGQWLLDILQKIGVNSHEEAKKADEEKRQIEANSPLFAESLFRMYTLLNRLQDLVVNEGLEVDLITWQRLIGQLIQTTTIPFHGEPAEGIQIMGVLETRNLDFDHLLVLSCNEGNIPKGVNDSSFIPYSIRKAFGLTTVDNKVAIYAYYFHSLIQRAGDITLTYNNATEDGHTGEMSRFMLQLMVESKHEVKRKSLRAGQKPVIAQEQAIEKDEHILEILDKKERISPSAINVYIRCQIRFYYEYILGLREPEEEDEDAIDNRIFGNIFHRACELFYLKFAGPEDVEITKDRNGKEKILIKNPLTIQPGEIEDALKHPEAMIEPLVDEAFREELFKVDHSGYKPEYNGLQLINREVIINYVKQLLTIDKQLAPFTILGLEQPINSKIKVAFQGNDKVLGIHGIIDRLDAVDEQGIGERIRVIDYKTGNSPSMKVKTIEEIFSGENLTKKHSDYFLQTIFYSLLVRYDKKLNPESNPVSPSLLFIQHAGVKDYDPTLYIDKERLTDVIDIKDDFGKLLHQTVNEIFDAEVPFTPTNDKQRCQTCAFAQICGL